MMAPRVLATMGIGLYLLCAVAYADNPKGEESLPAPTETSKVEASSEESEASPAPPINDAADSVQSGRAPGSLRTGFSLSAGTSMMFCLPDGKADCTNTYPGMALNTSMEVRFWYLGLSLDFDYGWFITEGDGVTSYALHATPVLKGYYPLETMEIFLGIGSGYSSIGVTESTTESEASWSTLFTGLKFTGGVWLDLEPHGMPSGFSLDLHGTYLPHFSGERCTIYAGAGPCLPEKDLKPSQRDVVDQLQLGTALRYTF